ncbi:DUF1273 domain-containing protein [Mariprofundus sp. NF]|uniref:hypothetical protein n=1 Tax=Mariprofundus sp. NF TaxID=2608716 RepID=UPI0015A268F4|nr:hypothetical protein [Mariprofundus sp. NF]NWF38278.1 DUF1273 domain-containing protein [Mariprofundus sp. NF]
MGYLPEKKIPIVVGITGHRQLANADFVRKEIFNVLIEILNSFPDSPVILMSALAVGADSIAAEVVIEIRNSSQDYEERLKLFCPLPMGKEEYEYDFNEAECSKYNELLDAADHVFELPLASTPEKCDEIRELLVSERIAQIQFDEGSERNNRYALLGAYLSRYSHILLAAWDGDKIEKKGGTYHVIRDRMFGDGFSDLIQKRRTGVSFEDSLLPALPLLESPDSGPTVHIHAHRTDESVKTSTCYLSEGNIPFFLMRRPESISEKQSESDSYVSTAAFIKDNLSRINMFNLKVEHFDEKDASRYEKSFAWLYQDDEENIKNNVVVSHLRSVAAAADAMAISRQETAFKDFNVLAVLSLLTAGVFLYNDRMSDESWVSTAIYSLLLSFTYLLSWYFSKKRNQQQHSHNRVIAEGLRVQIAWRIAGLHSTVFSKYPQKHRCNLGWVRHALRGLHVGAVSSVGEALLPDALERTRLQWVEDQRDYYEKSKINRDGGYVKAFHKLLTGLFSSSPECEAEKTSIEKAKPYIKGLSPLIGRAKLWSSGLMLLGMVASFFLTVLGYASEKGYIEANLVADNEDSIIFLVLVSVAVSLTIKMYMERMLLEEDLEWCSHSLYLFQNADKVLTKYKSLISPESDFGKDKCASVLLELGREVLHENSSWFDRHSKVVLGKKIKEILK